MPFMMPTQRYPRSPPSWLAVVSTLHEAYTDLDYTRYEFGGSVYTRCSLPSSMTAASVNEVLLAPSFKEESDLVMSAINNKFTITDCGMARRDFRVPHHATPLKATLGI